VLAGSRRWRALAIGRLRVGYSSSRTSSAFPSTAQGRPPFINDLPQEPRTRRSASDYRHGQEPQPHGRREASRPWSSRPFGTIPLATKCRVLLQQAHSGANRRVLPSAPAQAIGRAVRAGRRRASARVRQSPSTAWRTTSPFAIPLDVSPRIPPAARAGSGHRGERSFSPAHAYFHEAGVSRVTMVFGVPAGARIPVPGGDFEIRSPARRGRHSAARPRMRRHEGKARSFPPDVRGTAERRSHTGSAREHVRSSPVHAL